MRVIFLLLALLFSQMVFSQKNVQLRSILSYPERLSSLWGYADSAGNEYALVGVYSGFSIVNVTDADSAHEVHFIPGINTIWREVKTWDHYAYVTNEGGDGLLIIDLQFLPDSISYHYWKGDSAFLTAHTIFIDENGFAYLFGYNNEERTIPLNERGALICDLKPDPWEPQVVGKYDLNYIHDGFVRNDTLWAAQIYQGTFAVVDASNKSSLNLLAEQQTPHRFTHNCWLSDDGKFLFTTDEVSESYITSYDVSDLENIRELDRFQAIPFSFQIPHNTHYFNGFLINAYYKYGMNIVDAAFPQNLVEVGFYDTSPFPNSDGFNGCWAVYPYFPSGNILASDIEAGLFVLTPNYERACYLTGIITDDITGAPVSDVRVEVMTKPAWKFSDTNGEYFTGAADPGSYDIRFYKLGCTPKIITGVDLERGIFDTLNVTLSCTPLSTSEPQIEKPLILLANPTAFRQQTTIRYRINDKATTSLMEVFDVQGKLMHRINLEDAEGEIILGSNYEEGVYLVRLQNKQFTSILKIIKAAR